MNTLNGWGWAVGPRDSFFLLLILALTSLTGDAINPGCRCIRFVSTFGKEWGAFSSPDFPSNYPQGITCLLYLFTAPKDFIVQLNLSHIHLPQHPPNGCQGGDYLKLFLHLEDDLDGRVNEATPWNSLICTGQRSNETYFSASRHLVIQFHSSHAPITTTTSTRTTTISSPPTPPSSLVSAKNLGFHGFFRFLNSSQYENKGRLVAGSKCDYRFESRNYTSTEGAFFSPFYPSNYPHNAMCAYLFRARLNERIKLVFESVALEPGLYSCLNKTDVIRVLDGSTSRSPVIALICNSVTDYEIVSSGQDLLVEFIANSDNPGKGFRAKFHFIKVIYENPYDPLRFNLQQYFPKLDIQKPVGEDGHPQASTLDYTDWNQGTLSVALRLPTEGPRSTYFGLECILPQCDSLIRSDSEPNGSITSPNYPNSYQPKSHCRLDFIGHGRQRVQISFVDFDLFHSDRIYIPGTIRQNFSSQLESDKKCVYSDSISTFIYVNGVRTKVLEYCGTNPPPDMMSNDHRMTLEFSAKASTTTPSVRGFYAQYAFVEDFGLKSGGQLWEYPCAFVFNVSLTPNGSITSPNHPGLYPRDTECHYFFHGDDANNHVDIYFDHFDLAGTEPCESEKDDYIEYSNYMPTDWRFTRKCGSVASAGGGGGGTGQLNKGFAISSGGEGKFFRLTFRSNDGWADGTGFRAMFTFTHKINQIRAVNVNSSVRSRLSPLLLFYPGMKLALFVLFLGVRRKVGVVDFCSG